MLETAAVCKMKSSKTKNGRRRASQQAACRVILRPRGQEERVSRYTGEVGGGRHWMMAYASARLPRAAPLHAQASDQRLRAANETRLYVSE